MEIVWSWTELWLTGPDLENQPVNKPVNDGSLGAESGAVVRESRLEGQRFV